MSAKRSIGDIYACLKESLFALHHSQNPAKLVFRHSLNASGSSCGVRKLYCLPPLASFHISGGAVLAATPRCFLSCWAKETEELICSCLRFVPLRDGAPAPSGLVLSALAFFAPCFFLLFFAILVDWLIGGGQDVWLFVRLVNVPSCWWLVDVHQ